MSVVVCELNLGNDAEVLSRKELKEVLGGMGSGGSGGGSGNCNMCCWDDYGNDCSACSCKDGSHLSSCAPSMCTA